MKAMTAAPNPPKTLLLATDLSCRCDRALDRAVALATEWNARLLVLHVLKKDPQALDLPRWQLTRDPKTLAHSRVQRDLRGAEGVEIEVLVEQGDAAEVILRVSESQKCGLIVTGVARDETLGRMLLGGTVDALARSSKVPVLVAKSRPVGAYRNVVVATDFSEGSRTALEQSLALFPDAKLSLFHAYFLAFEGLLDDKERALQGMEKAALKACRDFLNETPAALPRASSVEILCKQGDPDELLQELVETRRGIDLIALGTEGRTGLSRVLLGSVAERLLNASPIDTLIVRRAQEA